MNKDKIIKDLKERNDKLENQRRQFELRLYHEQHLVEEKDKEIERLNNGCKELEQQIDDLHKLETTLTNENERLNNIINELEKWLNDELSKTFIDLKYANGFIKALDKLKELKGLKNGEGRN